MASTRSTRTWWRPARSKKTIEHPRSNIIMQRKYGPQLTMAVLIPFFQQLTGINVIMFYAPVSFETVGSGDDASLPPSPHVRCDHGFGYGFPASDPFPALLKYDRRSGDWLTQVDL
ncbi:hypothetical protein GW17_00020714 [Ensete ventricosum]|nr:hypothetical protein GW17_00020714 [Ensete ventricosum]